MPEVTARVDPDDLRALQHKLDTIAPPALQHVVRDAAPYVRDQARNNAPRQTGALVRSLVSEGKGLEARIHSPLVYALPQEFGRHRGGRGVKGRFFLRRAVQTLLNSELPRLFKKAIDELETAWGRR